MRKQIRVNKLLSFLKAFFFQKQIIVNTLIAITVWATWLILISPSKAISNLFANWEIALTMVFGSMAAGATSVGGGAVAFPILTKVLQISSHDAKVFSLAIQSVGMGAAALTIIAMRIRVEWQFIFWASLGGIPGIVLGILFLFPVLPPDIIKISFTMITSSFATILFVLNRTQGRRNLAVSEWKNWKRGFSLATGLVGGTISGLVGNGIDIIGFSVMVLLFGLSEKISTPTSVILMAINAIVGFIIHRYVVGDFVEPISSYWLAAIPIVVVGAPLGAIFCNMLKRETIVKILIGLIFIELVSSLFLIPLKADIIYCSLFILTLFSAIYYWMYKTTVGQN